MFALISDIHSNIEALTVVLADIREKGIDKIVCLGDVVGYGPNPAETADLVRENCQLCLKGNHDEAVTEGKADDFRPQARSAAMWTQKVLEPGEADVNDTEKNERWNWLCGLPEIIHQDGVTFVHGSPRLPTKEYIFPRDADNFAKMNGLFKNLDSKVIFGGHSHIPGVWTSKGEFYSPDDLCSIYMIQDVQIYVNVGSVGQPRDNNVDASYVTFDNDTVVFRRVPYNHEKTAEKILAVEELDDFFAKRLSIGR
jgi:predicted phosphodiesterase